MYGYLMECCTRLRYNNGHNNKCTKNDSNRNLNFLNLMNHIDYIQDTLLTHVHTYAYLYANMWYNNNDLMKQLHRNLSSML